MPIWRIVPTADPSDPRWQGGPVWEEVLVRAPLASVARIAAAEIEARAFPYDPIRNHAVLEATAFPSAFFDEKLYHVERADAAGADVADDDQRVEIISHRLRRT